MVVSFRRKTVQKGVGPAGNDWPVASHRLVMKHSSTGGEAGSDFDS